MVTETDGAIYCEKNKISLGFTLTSSNIFWFILKIHGILFVLPLAFLGGFVIVLTDKFHASWQPYVYFFLFIVSLLGALYTHINYYFIFRKLYFFGGKNTSYQVDFSDEGLALHQNNGKNLTEYVWNDFFRCRETKKTLYLFFRYDRAIIIKKHTFLRGSISELRDLIRVNIKKSFLLDN